MIKIDISTAGGFEDIASLEWLETNGVGGYASGTVSGAHTRRYHGHLIAATTPPLGRMVLLSKFEETLVIEGNGYELSCNQYPHTIHPRGYEYLTEFRLDPFPVWSYKIEDVQLEKRLFMRHGENTTVVCWQIKERGGRSIITLELRPLVAFRDHHHLRHEEATFECNLGSTDRSVALRLADGGPELWLSSNAASAKRTGSWYRNLEYAIEHERGFDHHEDLFEPCMLSFALETPATVIVSTEEQPIGSIGAFETTEVERRRELIDKSGASDDRGRQLVLAADQFIVRRGSGHTVIAGYHWFSDWGRDTMIAMAGLTLATGRPELARSIISEFSKHISEGMLPNRFPDAGEVPEYNTVDATLWYFEAIRAYGAKTGDYEFIGGELYAKLGDIIEWHVSGTRYGIRMDDDGLLHAGEPGVQLTWMDAKVGDRVITPRTGKPVEIQALWYNALCVMRDLAAHFNNRIDETRYSGMASTVRARFNEVFWNEEERCLYDVIDGNDRDDSIRPNQVFAVSLHNTMLDDLRSRAVIDKVESELLTPVGLRSLSPLDERYVPTYQGSPSDRDAAYHQGTVWGWLIGPFIDAYRRAHANAPDTQLKLRGFLAEFERQLNRGMLCQLAEIYDAEPPHRPRGAAAQAWSVAELLRVKAELEKWSRSRDLNP